MWPCGLRQWKFAPLGTVPSLRSRTGPSPRRVPQKIPSVRYKAIFHWRLFGRADVKELIGEENLVVIGAKDAVMEGGAG